MVLVALARRRSSRPLRVRNPIYGSCSIEYINQLYIAGRWPEKSVKFITRLLKNAESNADAKSLDLEDLVIKNIVVQQAPNTRRRTYRAHGRINPYQGHPCHVEIILAAEDEPVERAKDKDAVAPALTGLNRRQVARKRIEAARA